MRQAIIYGIVFFIVLIIIIPTSNWLDDRCLRSGGIIIENSPFPIWNKCFKANQ